MVAIVLLEKTTGEQDRWLTPDEVAEILRISNMTVYRRIKKGILPARQDGKLYFVLKSDLDRYIGESRIKPEQ